MSPRPYHARIVVDLSLWAHDDEAAAKLAELMQGAISRSARACRSDSTTKIESVRDADGRDVHERWAMDAPHNGG